MDKQLILRRFGESFEGYDRYADVQRTICGRLAALIPDFEVKRALEIGAGTGFLTRLIASRYKNADWFINDLSPEAWRFLKPIVPDASFIFGDGETMEFPSELDLIVAASVIQWFDDQTEFIARAAKALTQNGILAVSSFGPENFRELRSSASLKYLSINELAAATGLEIIHAEEWEQVLQFDTSRDLLKYIKTLGLNALSPKSNRIITARELTYHPMMIIAKKS